MRRAIASVVLAFGACRTVPAAPEAQVRDYFYREVPRAFAARSPEALGALFAPEIARPMTHARILEWGRDFFGKHAEVAFHVDGLDLEEVSEDRATAVLAYRVTTAGGKGDFGGRERDWLERRGGRWLITAWEKLD